MNRVILLKFFQFFENDESLRKILSKLNFIVYDNGQSIWARIISKDSKLCEYSSDKIWELQSEIRKNINNNLYSRELTIIDENLNSIRTLLDSLVLDHSYIDYDNHQEEYKEKINKIKYYTYKIQNPIGKIQLLFSYWYYELRKNLNKILIFLLTFL